MQQAPKRSWNPLHEAPLLPPTIWNRLAMSLLAATAVLLLAGMIGAHVAHGSVTWQGVLFVELPALLYLAGFSLGAWRVRPRKSLRGFFLVSFLPVLAYALCLFLVICLTLAENQAWLPQGSFLSSLHEQVALTAFWGMVLGCGLPTLLLVFARRALLLLCIGICGSVWLIFLVTEMLDSMFRGMYGAP